MQGPRPHHRSEVRSLHTAVAAPARSKSSGCQSHTTQNHSACKQDSQCSLALRLGELFLAFGVAKERTVPHCKLSSHIAARNTLSSILKIKVIKSSVLV